LNRALMTTAVSVKASTPKISMGSNMSRAVFGVLFQLGGNTAHDVDNSVGIFAVGDGNIDDITRPVQGGVGERC